MKRALIRLYGLLAYLAFLAAILYAIGFVADAAVPRTINRGGPAGPAWLAVWGNAGLLGLFAAVVTGYILIGTQLEERDLVRAHGAVYEAYRWRTPSCCRWGGGDAGGRWGSGAGPGAA